jgi:rod shape-determining protein MreD
MRWMTFFILAYIAAVLQSTLLGLLTGAAVGGATANLLLALALYYALAARRVEAPWACMTLGLIADLGSSYPFGVYTAAFGAVGWGVCRIRAQLFGEHPISVLIVSLVLTAVVELTAGTVALLRLPADARPWGRLAGTALLTAIFTAMAAVPLHWLLRRQRARRILGTPSLVSE